jgi:hypothetical protein
VAAKFSNCVCPKPAKGRKNTFLERS